MNVSILYLNINTLSCLIYLAEETNQNIDFHYWNKKGEGWIWSVRLNLSDNFYTPKGSGEDYYIDYSCPNLNYAIAEVMRIFKKRKLNAMKENSKNN